MELDKAIRQQFDRAATAYGTSPIFAKGHDLALLVETAKPTPDTIAIDVGCAAGHTAFAIAPHVREVIGVDLSPGMLAEAKKQAGARKIQNVTFQEAGATSLPFQDRSFDLATCRYAAHHFPTLSPFLTEMVRVLKPGGQLLIVDIISPEDPTLATFINQVEVLRDPSHSCDWKLSEWQAAFEQVGLSFSVVSEWRLPIDFVDWTARQQTPPDAISQLEDLLDAASLEVQTAFVVVGPPHRSFHLRSVLLQGFKGSA